jgi:hypothetical protein
MALRECSLQGGHSSLLKEAESPEPFWPPPIKSVDYSRVRSAIYLAPHITLCPLWSHPVSRWNKRTDGWLSFYPTPPCALKRKNLALQVLSTD